MTGSLRWLLFHSLSHVTVPLLDQRHHPGNALVERRYLVSSPGQGGSEDNGPVQCCDLVDSWSQDSLEGNAPE